MAEKKKEPKIGDIVSYTKEIDTGVIDEEGNRIPCKDIAQAKMLSLLLSISQKLEEK